MANTKIPVELSSTPGIVDNSNATAITIDSSENLIMTAGGTIRAGGANDLILDAGESGTPDIYLQSGGSTKVKIEGSNGNVGIGTSSPDDELDVEGSDPAIRLTDTSASGYARLFANNGSLLLQSDEGNSVNNSIIGFDVDGTEKMRIDSSGNVGIGTTSPSQSLEIGGSSPAIKLNSSGTAGGVLILSEDGNDKGYFSTANHVISGASVNNTAIRANGILQIATGGGTERMRIDSSGNVLVGKTSSSPSSQTGSVNYGDGFFALTLTNSRADTLNVYNTSASAYRFYLTSAGQIHATSTSITAISDERLKENIVDLETGLSEVMLLQPRRFDWKNGDGENVAGFIAQEVKTVLPDLISDYKHEELDDAKSVRMGDMIPTLVKAIQEQQAQIEALQSEINLLKGE